MSLANKSALATREWKGKHNGRHNAVMARLDAIIHAVSACHPV